MPTPIQLLEETAAALEPLLYTQIEQLAEEKREWGE